MARFWGREAFWNRYIVAFNWCQWLLPMIAFVLIAVLTFAQVMGIAGPGGIRIVLVWPRRLRPMAELVSRPSRSGLERVARRRPGRRGQHWAPCAIVFGPTLLAASFE